MKRSLLAGGLVLAFCAVGFAQGKTAATPNYAGTWELDVSKSQIPAGRGPKVTGQTLTITQDAKTITVASDTKTDGQMPVPATNRTYNLDGTETTGEVRMMQGSAPAKLNVKWLDGGKLELDLAATFNFNENSIPITQIDVLESADGGKTLKLHRTRTTPRGTEESDWVFTKK